MPARPSSRPLGGLFGASTYDVVAFGIRGGGVAGTFIRLLEDALRRPFGRLDITLESRMAFAAVLELTGASVDLVFGRA